jgi:peptidoglycan/LPS O-acetylase OafA/YrhL
MKTMEPCPDVLAASPTVVTVRKPAPVVARGSRVSDHLDMMRGLAALGVFVGHARNLFFVDYPEVIQGGPLTKAAYFATSLGHQMVMIFFVLSGYFIASTIVKDVRRQQWSWSGYLTRRGVRLYVVLLPALLLTVCWDQIGTFLTGNDILYQGLGGQNIIYDVSARTSTVIFVGNLFYLQTIFVPPLGSNGPLWSLSNEFWYYILFPCLVLIGLRRYSALKKVLCVVVALVIVIAGWSLMSLFPVWLMGATLVFLPQCRFLKVRRNRICCLAAAVIGVVAALVSSRPEILKYRLLSDYLVGMTFTLLVYVVMHLPERASSGWYGLASRQLAGMSYTLYVAHLPVLLFIAALFRIHDRWQPELGNILLCVGALLSVWIYAYVLSRYTEANTDSWRRWVTSLWSSQEPQTEKTLLVN